jgi:hypothetical protein
MGSMVAARSAGIKDAITAVPERTQIAARRLSGSYGFTRKSWLAR